eukprot:1159930-Pelagomonas_calceolata.AAC.1
MAHSSTSGLFFTQETQEELKRGRNSSAEENKEEFLKLGGQEWRFGGQKVGFTPWLIRHVRLNPDQ